MKCLTQLSAQDSKRVHTTYLLFKLFWKLANLPIYLRPVYCLWEAWSYLGMLNTLRISKWQIFHLRIEHLDCWRATHNVLSYLFTRRLLEVKFRKLESRQNRLIRSKVYFKGSRKNRFGKIIMTDRILLRLKIELSTLKLIVELAWVSRSRLRTQLKPWLDLVNFIVWTRGGLLRFEFRFVIVEQVSYEVKISGWQFLLVRVLVCVDSRVAELVVALQVRVDGQLRVQAFWIGIHLLIIIILITLK